MSIIFVQKKEFLKKRIYLFLKNAQYDKNKNSSIKNSKYNTNCSFYEYINDS